MLAENPEWTPDTLVEKLSPFLGVLGKLPEDYRPGRRSIFISRPE